MVSDVNQNVYINTALGEQGLRPIETLFPEAVSRLNTIQKAKASAEATISAIFQDRIIHSSVQKIIENENALTHADVGVKEFNASRKLDPQAAEAMIAEMEAYANSPEGMAHEARSTVEEIHQENIGIENLLSASNDQFVVG